MPRRTAVLWNKQLGASCTDIGGTHHALAKGKPKRKLARILFSI
jgi:hypothetical protein